MGPSQQIYLSR